MLNYLLRVFIIMVEQIIYVRTLVQVLPVEKNSSLPNEKNHENSSFDSKMLNILKFFDLIQFFYNDIDVKAPY